MKKLCAIFTLFFATTVINAELIIAHDTQRMGNLKKPTKDIKIELDKLKAIAKKSDLKLTIKAIPWKRSLLMVEQGLIDGVIQASYKKNRAEYARYPMKNGKPDSSKRLNDGNAYYIYRHKNSDLRWDGLEFIAGGTVAAMDKYAVIEDLKKHKNITIKTFTNNSEIIRKLSSGELDGYAGSSKITDELLKKIPSFAKNIVRESLPIRKKDYFLIFSKKTYEEKSKQMELLWEGLKYYNENNGVRR